MYIHQNFASDLQFVSDLQFANEECFYFISIVKTAFLSYPYSLIQTSSIDIKSKVFFLIFNKSTTVLSIEFSNLTLIGLSKFSTISLKAF